MFGDDAHRVGAVIAADIEETADAVCLKRLEDFGAIFVVGLVASRTQRRGRGSGNIFQIVLGLLREVDEILVDNALDAVKSTINFLDIAKLARF